MGLVGNITPGCSAQSLVDWCKGKGVDVIQCNVAESRFYGTACARVTIKEEDEIVALGPSFWPGNIQYTVRAWRFETDTADL